ncbi:MAG: tRNA (adenosine(37)-N6)-dimethylallyltransferase MiaA [Thermomicrobiales bacterium]|nr:tRNA (adenosine(37)-N6)-dimethylallyltransferase MiaA [Thermomicrobiales bacterium]
MAGTNNQLETGGMASTSPIERLKVVVVTGPTAVGKTALAIELAQRFGGEIVNADSRYLYQGFEIGVDKPTLDERKGIPHHLIDVLPPTGEMSLARYQDLANSAIREVAARGRLPILTGGTPLYVNAVVEGWHIPRVPPDPDFRLQCETEAAQDGGASLMQRLRDVDPQSADRCGSNIRRVIRALEIFAATGSPMSAQEGKGPRPFNTLEIGLSRPRDQLFRIIDGRIDSQISRGLLQEVSSLIAAGVPPTAPAMSSIGYRQLLPYLEGSISLEDALERIRFDTHRYVRHQETWLRKNPRLVRFDVSAEGWQSQVIAATAVFLRQEG